MKTLKKLSNKKLDELQDRLTDKAWHFTKKGKKSNAPTPRLHQLMLKIGNERLRRIGL